MSREASNRAKIDSALDVLLSIQAKDLDDANEINAATASLMRINRRHFNESVRPPEPISDHEQRDASSAPQEPATYDYANLSISEAAVEILKQQPVKETLSLQEIITAAVAGGYKFDGSNPSSSARAAFLRRAKSKNDLIQVSRKAWGLRDWYTQREITQFRHSEITKAGMAASGKVKGWAINAKQAADIKRRLAAGEKQTEIAKEFSLTNNTIYRYKKLLANWHEGDPFPPGSGNEDEIMPENDGSMFPMLRSVE